MSSLSRSGSEERFEEFYRTNADPWKFATSQYELGRYTETLAALSRPSYGTAFEPGCSVGVLTAQLARICRRVVAIDVSRSAVDRARRRCAALPNAEIHRADMCTAISDNWDLVVFSEIGYYFRRDKLTEIAASMADRLRDGGEFVAVHWLGRSPDHVLHGDTVHEQLRASLPLRWLKGSRHPGFRIDTWIRR